MVSDGVDSDTLILWEYIHVVGKVFPNPTSDIVNIYLDTDLPAVVKAEVFNLMGQKVFDEEIPDQAFRLVTIDLSSVSAGIYVIRLEVDQRYIFAKVMVSKL